MANEINMEVPMQGIIVGLVKRPAGTNRKTGEVIEEQNAIHLLVPQDGGAAINVIKCSPGILEKYRPGLLDFGNLASAKVASLLVNMKSWDMNGNKGISLKLVEAK